MWECICTVSVCAFPVRFAHYTSAHHTMFFTAPWRVKNKFGKLFLFVFIISVLYYICIRFLFCFPPSAFYPRGHPVTPLISLTLFTSFLKLETKVDARLIYYTPHDCHPTVLQCTSGETILAYYLYTQLMCAPAFTQFYLDTHTHTNTCVDNWTTDTVILCIVHDIM